MCLMSEHYYSFLSRYIDCKVPHSWEKFPLGECKALWVCCACQAAPSACTASGWWHGLAIYIGWCHASFLFLLHLGEGVSSGEWRSSWRAGTQEDAWDSPVVLLLWKAGEISVTWQEKWTSVPSWSFALACEQQIISSRTVLIFSWLFHYPGKFFFSSSLVCQHKWKLYSTHPFKTFVILNINLCAFYIFCQLCTICFLDRIDMPLE